jgi:PTS system cellobiose-specific IIA component
MKERDQSLEEHLMMMVAHGGNANSKVYEAIDLYSDGKKEEAKRLLEEAQQELMVAHNHQFSLLSEESEGTPLVPSVLMIHAMDICMNAANSIKYTQQLLKLFGDCGRT